jgi:hypothetical protein
MGEAPDLSGLTGMSTSFLVENHVKRILEIMVRWRAGGKFRHG